MNKAYYVDKWEDEEAFRLFQLHVARVKSAKPTITKEFYKTPPHPQNGNRLFKLGEKHRVAKDNKALGTRLCNIKLNKGEFGKMLDGIRRKKKVVSKRRQDIKRELEQRLLHEENLKLLQRLIEAKPFCKRSVWKKDRERIDHFLKVRQKQRVIPLRFRSRSQRQHAMNLAIEKSARRRTALAKRDQERKKGLYDAAPITPPLLKDYFDTSEKQTAKQKEKKTKPCARNSIEARVASMDKALQQEIKAKRIGNTVRKTPRPPKSQCKVVCVSPRAKRIGNKRKPKAKQFHYTRLPKEYFTDAKDKPDDEEIRKQLQQKPTFSEQQTTAARLIQQTIRTRLATEVKPAPLKERVAARKIQVNLRHTLNRKRQAKHHAATKIQSSLRGKLERRNMSFRKEAHQKDVAARRIQTEVRKSLSNRSIIPKNEEEECIQENTPAPPSPEEALKETGTTAPDQKDSAAAEATIPVTKEATFDVEAAVTKETEEEDPKVIEEAETSEKNEQGQIVADETALPASRVDEIDGLAEEGVVGPVHTDQATAAEDERGSKQSGEPTVDDDATENKDEDVTVNEEDEFMTVVRSLSREWTDNVLKSSVVGVIQDYPMTLSEFAARWWQCTMAELDNKRQTT